MVSITRQDTKITNTNKNKIPPRQRCVLTTHPSLSWLCRVFNGEDIMDKGVEFVKNQISKCLSMKTNEDKREELADRYNVVLFEMDSDKLDQEYHDKIGIL